MKLEITKGQYFLSLGFAFGYSGFRERYILGITLLNRNFIFIFGKKREGNTYANTT